MGDVAEEKRVLDYAQTIAMINEHFDAIGRSRITNPAMFLSYSGLNANRRNNISPEIVEFGLREKFWLLREAFRFTTREYAEVDFSHNTRIDERLHEYLTRNTKHFVHLSRNEPLYIAYTPDEAYGKRDRRVKTTVGRYLKKHYGEELSDADIRVLTDAFRYHFGVEDVLFASDEKDIVDVYTSGPHSCMAYSWNNESDRYGSPMHPAAVYAGYGIKVAYMKRDGNINARALVYDNPENPADKRWIRTYGDEVLVRKLEQLGYKPGNLLGAKLRKVPAHTVDGRILHNTYVCPYIDDPHCPMAQRVQVHDDYLEVVSSSRALGTTIFGATNTSGLVGLNSNYIRATNANFRIKCLDGSYEPSFTELRNSVHCSCCGKRMLKEGRSSKFHDIEHLCTVCVDEYVFAYRCESSGKALRDYIKPEHCILVSGNWVFNDEETRRYYSIVELDEAFYGAGKYAAGSDTLEFEGKIVKRDDLVALNTGGSDLRTQVLKTSRKINIGRAAPTKNVRVDTGNGWLRTAEGDWPILDDWIMEVCVHHQPTERLNVIRNTLHNETSEVQTRVHSWIESILTRVGMPELINEAKQISLLVEED